MLVKRLIMIRYLEKDRLWINVRETKAPDVLTASRWEVSRTFVKAARTRAGVQVSDEAKRKPACTPKSCGAQITFCA